MVGPPVKMVRMIIAVAITFATIGLLMGWSAIILEQTVLEPLQDDYFIEHTKAERDSAPIGSDLAEDQAAIANWKPTLLALKLVGIGTTLFGITIALVGILKMLSLMPIGLGDVLRAQFEDMGMGKQP